MYSDYKPQGTIDPDYLDQLNDLRLLLHLLKIKQFYAPGNEADDVICTLATKYTKVESVLIFTIDKDMMQLVTSDFPPVHMYDGKQVVDETKVYNKFGVFPYQICDYLALVGDKVDNVPGVMGIGEKKAVKLLKEYDNIESIPTDIFPNNSESIKEANRAKKLVTLNCEAQVRSVFDSSFTTQKTIDEILDKYELNSIKDNIEKYKEISGEKWYCVFKSSAISFRFLK